MARFTSPLDHVKVAAPCPAEWDSMTGSECVRFCSLCSLNVYNLSGMTRTEAETLLIRTEGRLCVRFYRRSDGTILTRQCPVGLRALKARVGHAASAVFSVVLGFLGGLGFHGLFSDKRADAADSYPLMGAVAVTSAETTVRPPAPTPVEDVEPVMGKLEYVPRESVGRVMLKQPNHIKRTTRR